jgi:hypothetical protein
MQNAAPEGNGTFDSLPDDPAWGQHALAPKAKLAAK